MKHVVRIARPAAPLCTSVRVFAQREIALGHEKFVEPVTARLEPVLEFQFGDAYRVGLANDVSWKTPAIAVVGPQSYRRAGIELSRNIESFGIFFHPAGLWRIFGIPVRHVTDNAFEAEALFGSKIVRLWYRLADAGTFEARVRVAEKFLWSLRGGRAMRDPIAGVADRILSTRGTVAVGDLARSIGLGLRQFERRFRNSMGMTPKYCSRVARFQCALDLRIANPNLTWLQVANWAGYFDQMHLVHDFEALGGMSPTRMLEEIRDQRPPAWIGENR
jgi:AraC-like DNA-binding protein